MSEGPYSMRVEKDVPITMRDGLVLRANVFRPEAEGRFPVILAHGVYGKDIHFADGFKPQWDKLIAIYPDLVGKGSSGKYLRWETVDPERFVPDGFIVIQVDSRGTGKSPGYLDPRSSTEMHDYYECIEWAGVQPWSNGKVGLCGISYYAFTQWAVAAMRPPHLAAICPWEGFVDYYRDSTHQGGIFSNSFTTAWWPRQVLVNQYGNANTHHRDRETGERTTGGPALSEDMLRYNRADYPGDLLQHPLEDAWYAERTPDLSRIEVPVLSAGNWGGPGLHLRGNIEGYLAAGSKRKWLSLHVGTHWDSFYLPEYVAMQKRFFSHVLKGADNGWDKEPPVLMQVRRPDGSKARAEQEFPLARTQWTKFYLDAGNNSLGGSNPATESSASYEAMGAGVDFSTKPFEQETEFCGFVTARLWVSSSTTDMDIFASLRVFDSEGKEVTFIGAHEQTVMAKGWLRVSHRKVDPKRALPYRVFHAHDEIQKIKPGEIYPVDVEIWPTTMVFPKGYRMVLTLQGRDFEIPGVPGRMLHNHPEDRNPVEFGGVNTIATGASHESYLLMPVIPAR
jgi:predicted acyl esterase